MGEVDNRVPCASSATASGRSRGCGRLGPSSKRGGGGVGWVGGEKESSEEVARCTFSLFSESRTIPVCQSPGLFFT